MYNRDYRTLKEIQQKLAAARSGVTSQGVTTYPALDTSTLSDYADYFVCDSVVSRWYRYAEELRQQLGVLGLTLGETPVVLSGSQAQASLPGTVQHAWEGSGGLGETTLQNKVQELIAFIVDEISGIRSISNDAYVLQWLQEVRGNYSDWKHVPSKSAYSPLDGHPWGNSRAYADYITISEANWIEASLYVANKVADRLISASEHSYISGTHYSGEEGL